MNKGRAEKVIDHTVWKKIYFRRARLTYFFQCTIDHYAWKQIYFRPLYSGPFFFYSVIDQWAWKLFIFQATMLDLLDAERTFITLGSLTKYKYNTKQIMIWFEKYKWYKKWNLEVKNIPWLQTFRCWVRRPYLWLPLEVFNHIS